MNLLKIDYNAEITEIESKVTTITELASTFVNAVEKKIQSVSYLVKKAS